MEDATDYVWWATIHGMPTVNGEGAWDPRRYADLYRLLRREWSDPSMGPLDGRRSTTLLTNRFPIEYIVVRHTAPPAIRSNIEATPGRFVLLTETMEADRVYRFVRTAGTPDP